MYVSPLHPSVENKPLNRQQQPRILFQGSPSGYGANLRPHGVDFKVWAPAAKSVDLLILSPPEPGLKSEDAWHTLSHGDELKRRIVKSYPMEKNSDGNFTLSLKTPNPAGTLYMYHINDGRHVSKPLPDPYSEAQPEDVHGPSMVVDDSAFRWRDQAWRAPQDQRQWNIYRLHVGTWTQEGTLKSAAAQLSNLKNLGFNAVELFPITEFPGKKNWGYDPSDLYAVENAYGKPDDLKAFVNEAHRQGVAVLLDSVYNHLSSEGQYLRHFDRDFIGPESTRWGPSVNWENPMAEKYITDNVRFWMERYHIDGFRLDNTPGIPEAALRKIVRNIRASNPNALVIAEDERNWNSITVPSEYSIQEPGREYPIKGFDCDAQWDFSYHHNLESVMTGERYKGGAISVGGWVESIKHGFDLSVDNPRHSLLTAVRYDQSHDEIKDNDNQRNVGLMGTKKAMMSSVIKFLLPGIPQTFMGQEYAEKAPFHYFSSSHRFRHLAEQRFKESTLAPKAAKPEHLRLTRDITRLRNDLAALWQGDRDEMKLRVHPLDDSVAIIQRVGKENPEDKVFALINFSDKDYISENGLRTNFPKGKWTEVLHTADKSYGGNGKTNHHATLKQGPHSINLPAWSISIWHQNTSFKASFFQRIAMVRDAIKQLYIYFQSLYHRIMNRILKS